MDCKDWTITERQWMSISSNPRMDELLALCACPDFTLRIVQVKWWKKLTTKLHTNRAWSPKLKFSCLFGHQSKQTIKIITFLDRLKFDLFRRKKFWYYICQSGLPDLVVSPFPSYSFMEFFNLEFSFKNTHSESLFSE